MAFHWKRILTFGLSQLPDIIRAARGKRKGIELAHAQARALKEARFNLAGMEMDGDISQAIAVLDAMIADAENGVIVGQCHV